MMTDDELAGLMLTSLRDDTGPTGMADLVEVARALGVTEHYTAQRVANRLAEQGLVEDMGYSAQAMPARLTDRGRAALEDGSYDQVDDRKLFALNGEGRTAEARGEA